MHKGLDLDQIWEQFQLVNKPTVKYAANKSSKEIAKMTPSCSAVLPQAVNDQSKMEQRSESGHCSGDDYSRKLPPTSDDRFFNVSQFLQEEGHKYENRQSQQLFLSVDEVDYFREQIYIYEFKNC